TGARGKLGKCGGGAVIVKGEGAAVAGDGVARSRARVAHRESADGDRLIEIGDLIRGEGGIEHGGKAGLVGEGGRVGPVDVEVPVLRRAGHGIDPEGGKSRAYLNAVGGLIAPSGND